MELKDKQSPGSCNSKKISSNVKKEKLGERDITKPNSRGLIQSKIEFRSGFRSLEEVDRQTPIKVPKLDESVQLRPTSNLEKA